MVIGAYSFRPLVFLLSSLLSFSLLSSLDSCGVHATIAYVYPPNAHRSDGLVYTVEPPLTAEPPGLKPCEISWVFKYREHVEDSALRMKTVMEQRDMPCIPHLICPIWNVPWLRKQLSVLREMQLARPRVTILLIHGEMGSPVAMTRLGYRHVKTNLLLLSDYDLMLSSTVVAELWRTHQEYKPTPVVVNGAVWHTDDKVGNNDDVLSKVPAQREEGQEWFLGFEDLGPEGPFYAAVEKKEYFPSLRLVRPTEPHLVHTDVNTPHLNLYDLELITAAGLDPVEMWDPKLSAQAFLSCSLILLAYAGNTRSLVNLNAVALTMEYTATGTFTDVIIYTLVYPPVETIQSSQYSIARTAFLPRSMKQQCLFRDMIGALEAAELNEPSDLPLPDDYASHAALLLVLLEQATFNSFNFQGDGPRHVQALGRASPIDVAGLNFRTAAGFLEQQLAKHPASVLLAATDYRIEETPLNMTFKGLLIKQLEPRLLSQGRRAVSGYQYPGRIPVDYKCLARTKPLLIVTGLHSSDAKHSRFVAAMRVLACAIVEDTADGSLQLWFQVYAAYYQGKNTAPMDIDSVARAFEDAILLLNKGLNDSVRLANLDARQRGRFVVPLGRLRVHYWAFRNHKMEAYETQLGNLKTLLASASFATKGALAPTRGVSPGENAASEGPTFKLGPVSGLPVLDMTDGKCRWHPFNTSCEVLGLRTAKYVEARWVHRSMTVKQGFEAIILLFDNAEADVTCRDALAKGVLRKAGLTSWTMLFVPAGLNCIGHLTRGRALLVAYQGPLTQPPGWEQQHPRAPMFTDLTTVAIPKFEHKADVFVFNATEHLRLLQLHLGYYHSKADGHEFSDNTYDELYVSYAGEMSLTGISANVDHAYSHAGPWTLGAKLAKVACGLKTRTESKLIMIEFHPWKLTD